MKAAEWVMLGILAGFALYDMKTKTIPVAAVVLAMIGSLIYRLCTGTGVPELVTGTVPGVVVLIIAFVTKESIGTGDGLVLCMLGLFCGWRQCLAVFGLALVLSAALAVVLLTCRRVGRKTALPFLPSLFGGYLLINLW